MGLDQLVQPLSMLGPDRSVR